MPYLNINGRIINTDQIAHIYTSNKGQYTTYYLDMSGADNIRLEKAEGEWLLTQIAPIVYSG